MGFTYLTPADLSEKIPYSTRHIRDDMKDRIFIEGYHYVRAPGGRRILFIWERVEEALGITETIGAKIPLASGGFVNV
jgi:hypothetical protein